LEGVENPVVRRKVAVPTILTFHELHLMIQAAMGWENQHYYLFMDKPYSQYFLFVSPGVEELGADATKIPAGTILYSYWTQSKSKGEERDKLYYEYDYGDYWIHTIDVIDRDDSDRTMPEVLEAEGACPPEDCGGIQAFENLKDYLSGKKTAEDYSNLYLPEELKKYNFRKADLKQLNDRIQKWRLLDQ